MTIHKNASVSFRTTMNKYDVSRWTSSANNQALYKSLAEASNSDMMKSDTIMFDPRQMISGTGKSHTEIDPSYKRFEQLQIRPFYLHALGLVIFLIGMRYLTCSPSK
jgi:hypothetical protein